MKIKSARHAVFIVMSTLLPAGAVPAASAYPSEMTDDSDGALQKSLQRGRFLIQYGGCNDCHTPGYAEKSGLVEDSAWLVGSDVGFRGPWGTTYAPNLRLYMQQLTLEQYIQIVRTLEMRPPMPWFNLRLLTDADLKDMYTFVRSLGPVGKPAPQSLPPGQEPKTKYIRYEPVGPGPGWREVAE